MANCDQSIVQIGNCEYPSLINNGDGTHTFFPGDGSSVIFPTSYLSTASFNNTTRMLSLTMSDGAVYNVSIPSSPTIVNNNDGTYTVTDELGNSFIITTNDTITSLTDNGNATFSYTSENGSITTFKAGWTTVVNNDPNDGLVVFNYPDGNADILNICNELSGCTVISITDGDTTEIINGGDIVTFSESGTISHSISTPGTVTSSVLFSNDPNNIVKSGTDGGVFATDTVTNLSYDDTNFQLSYTNETGITTYLDLFQCQNIINCMPTVISNIALINGNYIIYYSDGTTGTLPCCSAPENTIAAEFIASPISGSVPLTVVFTDQTTGDCSPITWLWESRLLPGITWTTFSSLQNPNTTFNTPGTYEVRLTTTCADGTTNSIIHAIIANESAGQTIVANWTPSVSEGPEPHNVIFTDTTTGDCIPVNWVWFYRLNNSGNGWTQFSTLQNPTNTFSLGTYDIRMIATCPNGITDEEIKLSNVTVTDSCISGTICYAQGDSNDSTSIDLIASGLQSTIAGQFTHAIANWIRTDAVNIGSGSLNSVGTITGASFFTDHFIINVDTNGGIQANFDTATCLSGNISPQANWTANGNICITSDQPVTIGKNITAGSGTGTITGNGTTSACVNVLGDDSQFTYYVGQQATFIKIESDFSTAIFIDLKTNRYCDTNYWSYCADTGIYTDIDNTGNTITVPSAYFTLIDCADVP